MISLNSVWRFTCFMFSSLTVMCLVIASFLFKICVICRKWLCILILPFDAWNGIQLRIELCLLLILMRISFVCICPTIEHTLENHCIYILIRSIFIETYFSKSAWFEIQLLKMLFCHYFYFLLAWASPIFIVWFCISSLDRFHCIWSLYDIFSLCVFFFVISSAWLG